MSRGEQAPVDGMDPVDGGNKGEIIRWEFGNPFSILRMWKSMVAPDREMRRTPFGKMKRMKKKALNQMKKEERPNR